MSAVIAPNSVIATWHVTFRCVDCDHTEVVYANQTLSADAMNPEGPDFIPVPEDHVVDELLGFEAPRCCRGLLMDIDNVTLDHWAARVLVGSGSEGRDAGGFDDVDTEIDSQGEDDAGMHGSLHEIVSQFPVPSSQY